MIIDPKMWAIDQIFYMKKYILYISVLTSLAFIAYGIKTVFDGDILNKEFWLTGIILICSQVPFYVQYKETSESGKEQ